MFDFDLADFSWLLFKSYSDFPVFDSTDGLLTSENHRALWKEMVVAVLRLWWGNTAVGYGEETGVHNVVAS